MQPIERVIRAGIISLLDRLDAILDATSTHPVAVYWLCAGSHFEIVNCVTDAQITMLILTPSPPFTRRRKGKGSPTDDDYEQIFVSKHTEYGPAERQVDKEEVPGAMTTQLEKPQ